MPRGSNLFVPRLYTPTSDSSSTAGSYVASNVVWGNWNRITTGTINYGLANTIWPGWTSAEAYVGQYGNRLIVSNETEDQRIARAARDAQSRREWEVQDRIRRAEREAADRRAEVLLHAHLDREQQQQLAERDWFLHVSKSGKRYRINRGRSANIDVLDANGKVVHSLCAHPRLDVPDADTMLAQALMLKHDEDEFLRMANVHRFNHQFRHRPLLPEERPGERVAA